MALLDRLRPKPAEPVAPIPCRRCGVVSWPALFRALAVKKEQIAADMGVSVATVRRLDQDEHHCTHELVVARLRETVRHKASYRERLRAADGAYPWPEDLIEREGKR